MRAKPSQLVTVAVLSAILTFTLNFLLNLSSSFLTDLLRPYAMFIYIALGIVFVASLALLVWQMRGQQGRGSSIPQAGTNKINQAATNGGQITGSTNTIKGHPNATIAQKAENAVIKDSPNTIEYQRRRNTDTE